MHKTGNLLNSLRAEKPGAPTRPVTATPPTLEAMFYSGPMRFVFNERKTAQAAARLLERRGGAMPYIKLMKLLYLADRKSLIETGYPITGDRFVSMDRGPVLSQVLDFITWGYFDDQSAWPQYVSPKDGWDVRLNGPIENDELSPYEMSVLDATDETFGGLDRWTLVKYTHDLPEWVDPHGGSLDIDARVILREAGKTDEEIQEVAAQAAAIWFFKNMYAASVR